MIGGQLIIYSNRLANVEVKSGLPFGTVSVTTFIAGRSRYCLCGTYWPTTAYGGCALMTKLKQLHEEPIEVIKAAIAEIVRNAKGIILVSGDFNTDVTKDDNYNLEDFMIDNKLRHTATMEQLTNHSYHKQAHSSISATRIDYALIGKEGKVVNSELEQLNTFSGDHSILITTLECAEMEAPKEIMNMPATIDINLRNDKSVEEYVGKLKMFTPTSNNAEDLLREMWEHAASIPIKGNGKAGPL
jgi:hypothetical protein